MPRKSASPTTAADRRARNRLNQRRWRRRHPERARELQRARPSYQHTVTGESLGLGRPMTPAEAGRLGGLATAERWRE